jgi:KDO2-lipid IV(A) lauroyltransferase
MTRRVFYSFIRSHFDLFHTLRLPQEQVMASVDLSASAQPIVHALRDDPRPFVLVALHLGNFDLAGQTLSAYRPQVQALSLPNPTPGFQFANELRQRSGIEVTPLSPAAIRQAVRRLRLGGTVAIGADRPVSDLDEPVAFFGRPARMPSGHVRLALKTDAVVAVCCCPLLPETQRYTVHVEPFLEMVRTGNRDEEVRINMRRVLDQVEGLIQRWPDQWQMFVPVWPELADQAET